jgi:type I restriction enzyme, S subunit
MPKSLRTVLSYVQRKSLPANWHLASVGDLITGAQYGMNVATAPDGRTPIVGMKDIKGGRVQFYNLAKTNVSDVELATFRLRKGDVLINRTNSLDQVGKAGIVDRDENAVFVSYLVRLSVDPQKIEPEYLTYWLNTDLAQRTIRRIATPAIGQVNLNPTEFQKYCLVPIPPRSDRLRIIEAVRTWDDAIEKTNELIGAKQRRIRGMLSESVSDARLRHEDSDRIKTTIGEVMRLAPSLDISHISWMIDRI